MLEEKEKTWQEWFTNKFAEASNTLEEAKESVTTTFLDSDFFTTLRDSAILRDIFKLLNEEEEKEALEKRIKMGLDNFREDFL